MECPDCGAFYNEKDEFCGECGSRLSPETSGEPAKAEVETLPPALDTLDDLARDLFEPVQIKASPRKDNLLPIVIGVGVALLLLCLGATTAIVWFFIREEPAAPPPTPIVVQEELAATPPATSSIPQPGALLYEENFDGLSGDWSVFGDEDTIVGYADGEYHIAVYRTNYMAWGLPESPSDLSDMLIEVDARQVEGPLDNSFGLLVRYVEYDDQYSYYWFQISGDGFYSVDLFREDEWVSLVGWEPSPAIYTGLRVTSHISVVCSGDQFSFYANDVHLADIVDNTLASGGIGLAAAALDETGVMVQFDNLRVYGLGD